MSLQDGNSWSDHYARLAFPILVQKIEETVLSGDAHQPFTYEQLASILGIHHRPLHWILGVIGHAIEQLDKTAIKKWHTPVPPIEVLVCRKGSYVPGSGGLSFLSRYLEIPRQKIDQMPEAAKRELVLRAHDRIYSFQHWREVLEFFGLKPTVAKLPPLSATLEQIRSFAFTGGGESEEHKLLKEYLRDNPSLIGINTKLLHRATEEIILSGDRLDVFLKGMQSWFCIEVKPSDSPEPELIRGLFQCVKYKVVLVAQQMYERMHTGSAFAPEAINVYLVLGGVLPKSLEPLRRMLGVKVFQNIEVPTTFRMKAAGSN